jgi:hypothetical protein
MIERINGKSSNIARHITIGQINSTTVIDYVGLGTKAAFVLLGIVK